jgi:molybdopterin-containing oxidoreductase family membrane subunit
MWFLLFIKQLPVIAIAEVKEIVPPRLRRQHTHGISSSGEHFDFEPETPGEHE